jgi:perosamine synthetase
MMTGAKPVFVDVDPASLNIDPDRVEGAVTGRTRAILPVEIFGSPAGFDKLCEVAERHSLPIVEDSCEALGSTLNGRKAGTFGALSVFGFYPNKQITTGEGGMVVTDDDDLADQCVLLRNQGRKGGGWLAHECLGYNFRLSDINCALGLAQLSRLAEIVARRSEVAAWYRELLAPDGRLVVPTDQPGCQTSWFVYVVRLAEGFGREHRDHLVEAMTKQKIQVSNYFPPVHLQPFVAQRFGHRPGDFPIAEAASQRTIALPFHAHLSSDDVALVCGALRGILDASPA